MFCGTETAGDEGDGGTCSVVQRQREMREMEVRVLWYRDSVTVTICIASSIQLET